ncbi:MAG: hypothetical protein H0T17_00310 [Propionibacteriales bacterium]|nr:hypothetical protein [Propionibacteriales bacterium]
MHRPKPLLSAVAAVAATALAACSNGSVGVGEPPAGGVVTGEKAVAGFDSDRDGPAAPIEGALPGGTVTALTGAGLATLDPTASYFVDTNAILSGLVTRSLTQYAYDPEQGTMVLVPDLATDLGTPNADFTQWSFTIRAGVRFEDGKEVTAEDVAYGIKRSFDRTAFPAGPTYSNDYFLNGETYKGPYASGTSYPGVVVAGSTLTIEMERPFPDMPYWGAFPAMGPIPDRGSDPATYGRHPLATGPYRIAEYTPGESLTLVRNGFWDPDTDPGRHAYPDRYEFRFEPPERIDATVLGDSQAAQTTLSYGTVLSGDYRRAQQVDRLTLGSAPCAYFWWPDYRKITDILVRKAIGYAYPYREDAKTVGAIFGVTALPGTSILPPGFPGRQDYSVLATEPGRTDPDKAKALLREAGWAPGEYELTFAYSDEYQPIVERRDQLVEAMEAAGFKVTTRLVPTFDDVLTLNKDPNAPVNVRSFGWCPDWRSGSSWFPPIFHSGGAVNLAYFAEPGIDAEIDRIGRLPLEEQPAAWGALDKAIMTDYYPGIVTRYDGVAMLHGSRIGGMNIDEVYGMPTWKDIYVGR